MYEFDDNGVRFGFIRRPKPYWPNGGTYPLLVSDFCRLAAQEVNLIPFLTRSKYVLLQGHILMYQVNCLD